MPRLVYLAASRRDLLSILDYIVRESGGVAGGRRFVTDLRSQCAKLASLPGTLGRGRPELRPDIRSVPYKGYVIFFRYREGSFEVLNIIEGHRDVEQHFAHKAEER